MKTKIDVNELDEKMQKNGWKFLGAILHYEKAWKNQASIYEKNGEYVVSGIDSSGQAELHEPISKKEAEKRIDESIKEIRRLMFGISK
jgi:hypothetical protein